MKNLKYLFVSLSLLSLLVLSSCDDNAVDPVLIKPTSASTVTDSFFTKLNGNEFVDTNITVNNTNNIITIAGINTLGDKVTIGIKGNLAEGTYPITSNLSSSTDVVSGSYINSVNGNTSTAFLGGVTITSKTASRIVGTFNFKTMDQTTLYQFTEGTFDVAF